MDDVEHKHKEEPSKQAGTPTTSSSASASTFNLPPSDTFPQPDTSLDTIHKNLAKRFKTDEILTRIKSCEGLIGSEPLILIHDGSGISVKFQKIKPLERELWGIANPKTFATDTWEDLNAMASAYAAKIANTIVGPYIIGGKASASPP